VFGERELRVSKTTQELATGPDEGQPAYGLAIRPNPANRICVLPDQAAMSAKSKLTTTVSTKGQVILPEVLLKPEPAFAPTRPKDVFGSLPHEGSAKTLADMEAGIAAEAGRRHARDRC
jgi:hypothetical protein